MAVNSFRRDEATNTAGKKETLVRLFAYLFRYKLQIAGVLLVMGTTIGISLINPLLIERAIDVYIKGKDLQGLLRLGMFTLLLNLVFVILIKVRMYVMAYITNKILLEIRQELYEHIQTLSFQFFDSRPTGKILARIIGDVNSLKNVLTNSVTTLIPDFITIVGVVLIMFVKDARLAAAALSSLPLMIAGIWLIGIRSRKRWQAYRKKGSNVNAYVHEGISGMHVIQSFSA
ncbi:MAG: ABC transporter transmembrane domain-containing protein, partial [Acetivibrio ethanolgignens]